MVADLHKLERHVVPPFYFTSEHIESFLSRNLDREAMLKIAALVAERRASPSFVNSYALAIDAGNVGQPEWFYTIFPDIERRREEEKKNDKASKRKEVTTSPPPPSNSAFLKNAVSVKCYNCGFENPFKSTLRGDVSFLNPSDPIHKESMEPILYVLPAKVCWNCHKPFSIKVRGRTKVESIPPIEENDDYLGEQGAGTAESKLGLIDFIPDAAECKKGCVLCHWVFATKEGRFKLDHATGRFTVSAQ